MYRKRAGTSGICGQLFESKLVSLLYFRALHDDTIEKFQLASNIDKIGAFDDVCFKAKIKGHDKPLVVFIQAKHRENDKQTLKHDLPTYYDSYKKIRNTFKTSNKDEFFRGTFEGTECLFVIYTNATDNFSNGSVECSLFSHVNYLIDTHGTAKQPFRHVEYVEFRREIVIIDQVTLLAERVAKYTSGKDRDNFENILADELMQCYHVILAQNVFDVSEIVPVQSENGSRHRIATFRRFIATNHKYLIVFKEILYREILKQRKINPADENNLLSEYLDDPTDTTTLSKLIGTIITYNNGRLEFINKRTNDFQQLLNEVNVSQWTVDAAVELYIKNILSSRKFKVPVAFGNKDLTVSGSDAKIERRINYLTSRIIDLLHKYKSSKIVTIDETLENGFLKLSGGIAGAIGNIFVLDDDTKQLKITDNWESLEIHAKMLYDKLSSKIHNLHEFKFCLKVDTFPKVSFDCCDYENYLTEDFLNRLLFYSNQADENGVEEILKSEIEDYQHDHPNYLQVKTDAIFSNYHNEIQKWWKQSTQASYLTRESDLFQHAKYNQKPTA